MREHTDPSPRRASPPGFGAQLPGAHPPGWPRSLSLAGHFPPDLKVPSSGAGQLPRLSQRAPHPERVSPLPAPRALRSRSRPPPAPGTALGATDQPCRCWEAGGGTQVLGSARTRTAALRGVSRRPRARGRGLWLQERRLPPPARPLRPEAQLFPRPTAAHPLDPLGKGRTGPKSEVWAG